MTITTEATASTNGTVVDMPPSPPPSASHPPSSPFQYQSSSSTQQHPHRSNSATRQRTYRGGFTTSICDIFRNPTRRTDCCALACCGVLSADRTRYLLKGERPPPLWRRVGLYLIVPALFLAAMNFLSVEVAADEFASGSSSSSSGESSSSSGSGTYDYGNNDADTNSTETNNADGDGDEEKVVKVVPFPLTVLFIVYLIALFSYGRREKRKIREEIMAKLYIEHMREQGQEVDPLQLQLYLQSFKWDASCSHRMYGCYKKDYVHGSDGVLVMGPEVDQDGHEIEQDFCSRLWDCLAKSFFGAFCGCWCQCCSICALAQEEREVNRLTGNMEHTMDYITFQPYSEYYPSIQNLRENQISSLWKHVKAISELSVKLLKNMAAVLIVLALFALTDIDSNFDFSNMIVLLLTLGQAFFIEYLVHWRWNRFHLSFDSVVKYFACGFLLTTPMALAIEAVVSTVATLVFIVIVSIVVASDKDLAEEISSNSKNGMKDLIVQHQGVFIFYVFLNSFCVAALVEEMIKYFGYWMVVVPDLLPQNTTSDGNNNVENDDDDVDADHNAQSANGNGREMKTAAKSTGIGITVAMVSVALGFACCENMMYIFVYSPPSLGVEISTLLARSLFPVHPLCAAIQSIGVCKRDIEGERKYGLGRVISPAVLLHGSFDFVLMLSAYLQQVKTIEQGNDDDNPSGSTANDEKTPEDLAAELPALIAGIVFVVTGYVYYVAESRKQTARLEAMDNAARDHNSLLV